MKSHDEKIPLVFILSIFALALSARLLVYFLGPHHDEMRSLTPDSGRYLLLAENLMKYKTFAKQSEEGLMMRAFDRLRAMNGTLPEPDKNGLRPESFRALGYPVFIAAVRSLFDDVRAVLVFQAVLGALMACLVPRICKAFGFSTFSAVLIGFIWAFHPALILYDLMIMSESFFNICVISGLYIIARVKSSMSSIIAGVLFGVAALARPYLGLFYLPIALVLYWRKRAFRWLAIGGITLSALLPTVLWSARNYLAGEGFRLSTAAGIIFYFNTVGYVISEERREDWLKDWPTRIEELSARLEKKILPKQDVGEKMCELAYEEIAKRPLPFARVMVKSTIKLLIAHSMEDATHLLGIPYEPSGLFSRFVLREGGETKTTNKIALAIALSWILLNIVILVEAFLGLILSIKRGYWSLVLGFSSTFLLLLMTVSVTGVGQERFRIVMMVPILFLVGLLFREKPKDSV